MHARVPLRSAPSAPARAAHQAGPRPASPLLRPASGGGLDALERQADHVAALVQPGRDRPARDDPAEPEAETGARATPRPLRAPGTPPPDAGDLPAHVRAVLATPGEPLEPASRAVLEPQLGHDFSRIRIHADRAAQQSARRLQAQAYAAGPHIAFAHGRYRPGSAAGRSLLAHELAHVVQQAGLGVATVQCKGDGAPKEWTVLTEISVEAGATGDGRARGVDAAGQVVSIDVEVNKLVLDAGRYTLRQKEMDADWDLATRVHQGESRGAAHFVYVLPAHVKVAPTFTLVIAPRTRTLAQVWREIRALPRPIQDFVTGRSGRAATLDDYERALRVGRQLQDAGLNADEVYQLGQKTGGRYTEKGIAAALAARSRRQSERSANVARRGQAESRLFGREALYKRYLALLAHLARAGSLAAVAGASTEATGLAPDLVEERDQLDADLRAADFADGIAGFARSIDDYEKSFQREALAYAMDVLLKYEHLLHQEYARYAGGQTGEKSAAAQTLAGLAQIRAPAQKRYAQAARARSLRKDLDRDIRDMGDSKAREARADSERLGREAARHEGAADRLVQGAVPDASVVGWQDFPREKLLAKRSVEDVRYEIAWYIAVHEAAIQRARRLLTDKPSRIYTLDKLLSAALEAQDVEQGSIFDLIVQHRVSGIQSEKKVREILLAVLTVALTVVTLGGGTPALLAGAAIVGIGGAQAYSAIEDYDTQTTLYLSQLLSEEPTAAWAIVAVVGLALDAGSLVAALSKVVPAAKAYQASGDLAELGKELAQVDARVRDSVLKAAEQAGTAERQFKASVDQLKRVLSGAGGQARAVVPSLTAMAAQKGGEIAGRLLAMTYYYIKSRLLKSFPKFLRQLEQDGLLVWAELAPAQQRAIRQAFDEALALRKLPYGGPVYARLSARARQTYTEAAVDRFAAQGKAVGKTDDEIVAALEAELQSQQRAVAAISSTERTGPGGAVEIRSAGRVGDAPQVRPGLEKKYPLGERVGLPGNVRFHVEGIKSIGDELNVVYAPERFNISETALIENQIRAWRDEVAVTGGELYYDISVHAHVLTEFEGVTIRVLDSITWKLERRLPGSDTVETLFEHTGRP